MNIVDAILLLLILAFGVVGLKNGVFRQTIQFFGVLIIIYLAFVTKDFLANIFLKYLPFFEFAGDFKGLVSLNILIYQILAFLIMLSLYGIILQIIVSVTGVFEKILKYTIILGIPSKILGFFMGLLQGVLVAFVLIVLINQPLFDLDVIKESKLVPQIATKTPILSTYGAKLSSVASDINSLKDKYLVEKDIASFNRLTIDSMLKYNIVNVKILRELVNSQKLSIEGIDGVLNKY